MEQHRRSYYMQELENVHTHLIKLGEAATSALKKAVLAYTTRDTKLAYELVSEDLHINTATVEIEKEVHRIVALQQPVAGDLRMIFVILHISSDLERIADHAVSIAKTILRRGSEEKDIESITDNLQKMAVLAETMISESLEAYINKDLTRARQIAAEDEKMDKLLKEIYCESAKYMQENPAVIPTGIRCISVGNSLERIADYVTNICERIVFLDTGEVVNLN